MDQAIQLWAWWQSLLSTYTSVFTWPGWVRCVQWVPGMVLRWEEHTITQILTALGLESRWRVLEHVAEHGAWDPEAVERQTQRPIEKERRARWGRYHPVAVDDTKLHRTSKQVWGTCTFHESSARSRNRAETVRAHHWVVMGDWLAGRLREIDDLQATMPRKSEGEVRDGDACRKGDRCRPGHGARAAPSCAGPRPHPPAGRAD
jgi:hypothetical protein